MFNCLVTSLLGQKAGILRNRLSLSVCCLRYGHLTDTAQRVRKCPPYSTRHLESLKITRKFEICYPENLRMQIFSLVQSIFNFSHVKSALGPL